MGQFHRNIPRRREFSFFSSQWQDFDEMECTCCFVTFSRSQKGQSSRSHSKRTALVHCQCADYLGLPTRLETVSDSLLTSFSSNMWNNNPQPPAYGSAPPSYVVCILQVLTMLNCKMQMMSVSPIPVFLVQALRKELSIIFARHFTRQYSYPVADRGPGGYTPSYAPPPAG
jgi:hypothetical protein